MAENALFTFTQKVHQKFSDQSWKKVCFAAVVYGDKLLIGKNIMIFKLVYQHFS